MSSDKAPVRPIRRLLSNRRGLLAGAAVLAAGALQQWRTEPAHAAGPLQGDSNTNQAPGVYGFNTGDLTSANGVYGEGRGTTAITFGVTGITRSTNSQAAGVNGEATATLGTGVGVFGKTLGFGEGVRGEAPGAGVYGKSSGSNGFGVYGTSNGHSSSTGVYGNSIPAGRGVEGRTDTGIGVRGVATGNGGFGVDGEASFGTGVRGYSFNGVGVQGTSTSSYGLAGASTTSFGLVGASSQAIGVYGRGGTVGIYGVPINPGGFAAQFNGNVVIQGSLTVTGSYPKSAAVKKRDGTQARMYCMESPESWFEDFGTAELKQGQATVDLDPEFDQVVKGDDYRVFLTPIGVDCSLYVSRKGPHRFDVRTVGGALKNGTFDFRVVARRFDNVGKRMEKVVIPPTPDLDLTRVFRTDATPVPPVPPKR